MADGGTIAQRITDLIGTEYSTNAAYSGDLINAAINEIADMISEDLLIKYSPTPGRLEEASEWLVEGRKILKVTRVDADSSGVERECQPLDRAAFSSAQDSGSIHYATVRSPVYHLDSKNAASSILIIPVCNGTGQEGRIWYFPYVANSVDSTAITQATVNTTLYLPNNLIHAIVLKSCVNILKAYISNQIQDEEDLELMQMIQGQAQVLEKDYMTEIGRFVDEPGKTSGSE